MSKIENIDYFKKNDEKISTSEQPTENEIKLIAEDGFEVLINARPQSEMDEIFDEKKLAENLGMKYFLIETELGNPSMDELTKFLELMTKFEGKKIFLHCHKNKRASGLLAVYRVVKLGWEKDNAIKKVKEIWEMEPDLQNFIDVQINYLKK